MRANFELLRGRMSDPSWALPPTVQQQADVTSAEASGRGKRSRNREPLNRSPSVQVDRELMMTTGEAAATNDRLPKGFMYVPYNVLSSAPPG